MFRKKKVGYVSDIDQFLTEFDKTHAKSEAQLAEINKYQRIHEARDHATEPDSESVL